MKRATETRRPASPGRDLVGRQVELDLAVEWLAELQQGRGRVVTLSGEAGIGKTCLLQEICTRARRAGALVLAGRCVEGAATGYGPFREALGAYIDEIGDDTLREQLRSSAAVIAQLVPRVRARLPEIAEPPRLQPDEERVRLLDAIHQLVIAAAARAPLVLVLDDVHWADDDTLALFRHVGRTSGRHRILLLAAYREGEVEEESPLAQTLVLLRRATNMERIRLAGLEGEEIESLLQAMAEERGRAWSGGPVDAALSRAIGAETRGNPFFVRSLVLHLLEEGRLSLEEGVWNATMPLAEPGLPENVRQLLCRRIGRLRPVSRVFLETAAVAGGTFRFDVVAAAVDWSEEESLGAVDEILRAQLVEPAMALDSYTFAHALVRQTVCEEIEAPRRETLHRRVADVLRSNFDDGSVEHAAEIAAHYHRSRSLPGAERGVSYALAAAAQAESSAAFAEAAGELRRALDLLPVGAPAYPRIAARLSLALIAALRFSEGVQLASVAAAALAEAEDPQAGADHLAEVLRAMLASGSGLDRTAELAQQGLVYAGDRRDRNWTILALYDIARRELAEANGIPFDSAERRELALVLERTNPSIRESFNSRRLTSRAAILAADPEAARYLPVGDYRGGIRLLRQELARDGHQGRIGLELAASGTILRWHVALGEFDEARVVRAVTVDLAERLPEASIHTAQLIAAEDEWRLATDENWDEPMTNIGAGAGSGSVALWYRAGGLAALARRHAHMGRNDQAMHRLASLIPVIEGAPGWADTYPRIICDAAATLWLCRRDHWLDVIERNLLEKVIEPDFRYPMMDARLSMARLCALREAWEEAEHWFVQARALLDEQGARPLRAIADYDEALMYVRRGLAGDPERAQPVLDAALAQFRSVGMPGWTRRAEALLAEVESSRAPLRPASLEPAASVEAVFREEGEHWTVAYDGVTVHLGRVRGMQLLSHLLAQPGRQIAAIDLLRCDVSSRSSRDQAPSGVAQAERARVNATRAIATALGKIAALHPSLGDHLRRTVRTGATCCYAPDPRAPIDWQL